jgi:hypothetical protein
MRRETQKVCRWYILQLEVQEENLEQTLNLASLEVDVDVQVAGSGGQTGDGLDVGCESVQVAGAGGHSHVADGHFEACGRAFEGGVVGERVLRLGDADGEVAVALLGVGVDLLLCDFREGDRRGAVHLLGNGFDAGLGGAGLGGVQKLEVVVV